MKSPFKKVLIPTGPDVCQKQLLALMHKVHEVKINEDEIGEFLPAVYEELKDLSKEEIIKRFASIEFNRFLDYYRNAPDLNVDAQRGAGSGSERYPSGSRFFINVGKMDGVDVSRLLELIDDYASVGKNDIGRIDLKGAYSFFEVDNSKVDAIMRGINGINYKGRQVRVELTDKKEGEGRSSRSSSNRDRGDRKGRSSSGSRDKKREKSSGGKGKWR